MGRVRSFLTDLFFGIDCPGDGVGDNAAYEGVISVKKGDMTPEEFKASMAELVLADKNAQRMVDAQVNGSPAGDVDLTNDSVEKEVPTKAKENSGRIDESEKYSKVKDEGSEREK